MQVAIRLGYSSFTLESDVSKVVNMIKHQQRSFTPLSLIIDDISLLSSSLNDFSVLHVKRSGNTLAHNVARWDISGCNELVCLGPFPQSLLTLGEIDLY